MRSRRRLALLVVLVLMPIGVLQAATAGARPSRSAHTWHYFHVHMNAYDHWGSCTADWSAHSGQCTGLMEAGTFEDVHFAHSEKISWYWSGTEVVTYFDLSAHRRYLKGTKPHNWHTFTATAGFLAGRDGWVTGTDASPGHVDGPLFVNLTSHSDIHHKGYSIDLHGYLRQK
jgi:hypothetical protein